MYNFNKELTFDEISIIFDTFLKCPDFNGCENCILNDCLYNNQKIGCFKLRDLAMQRVIDEFWK